MTDVWSGIAGEFLHLYPRGARLLAIAGADAARSQLAAQALGTALTAAGAHVTCTHSPSADEQQLRAEVVTPFRRRQGEDRVMIVSGGAPLLDETARRLWHWSVWQLAGDESANTDAAAIVDLTDPVRPTRRYADFCTCDVGENPLMSPAVAPV